MESSKYKKFATMVLACAIGIFIGIIFETYYINYKQQSILSNNKNQEDLSLDYSQTVFHDKNGYEWILIQNNNSIDLEFKVIPSLDSNGKQINIKNE